MYQPRYHILREHVKLGGFKRTVVTGAMQGLRVYRSKHLGGSQPETTFVALPPHNASHVADLTHPGWGTILIVCNIIALMTTPAETG